MRENEFQPVKKNDKNSKYVVSRVLLIFTKKKKLYQSTQHALMMIGCIPIDSLNTSGKGRHHKKLDQKEA